VFGSDLAFSFSLNSGAKISIIPLQKPSKAGKLALSGAGDR